MGQRDTRPVFQHEAARPPLQGLSGAQEFVVQCRSRAPKGKDAPPEKQKCGERVVPWPLEMPHARPEEIMAARRCNWSASEALRRAILLTLDPRYTIK